MQHMRYGDMMTRPDYDELENSIVDSLSEVSIASNVQLNNHTQEIVNKTISEVVSIYLWSSSGDTNSLYKTAAVNNRANYFLNASTQHQQHQQQQHQHQHHHHVKNINSSKKSTAPTTSKSFSGDIDIEKSQQPKMAWESIDTASKGLNTNTINLGHGIANKKDEKTVVSTTNKITIPYLDLSYLSENNNINQGSKSNTKFIDESANAPKSDEHNSSKKGLSRQKSHEGNMHSTSNKSIDQKTSESKSKISDSNITIKSRNEYPAQTSIKYEIDSLLKELKLARNSDTSEYYNTDSELKLSRAEQEKLFLMAVNLKELLNRLLEKRRQSKRNINVDKMTREEIQAEKIDTQKELLAFEERHGRPQTKLEKDLMRPLYDHYRKVKRILSKNNSGISQDSQTGNEDNMIGEDDDAAMYNNLKDHKHFVNLHSLNLNELTKEKETALLEKSKLKDIIKKYESDFSKATGRALTKEDREYHKDFDKYKFLKAKLKLIDALIEKYEVNKK